MTDISSLLLIKTSVRANDIENTELLKSEVFTGEIGSSFVFVAVGTRLVSALVVLLILTSCALGPDYQRPILPVPTTFENASVMWEEIQNSDEESSLPPTDWWSAFSDPVLDHLIQTLREENQDLKVLAAEALQRKALYRVQRSELFPDIDLLGSFSREQLSNTTFGFNSANVSRYNLLFDLNYEIDLWGRVRRATEAAQAEFDMSLAELRALELLLTIELASNYFTLRAAVLEKDILTKTLQTRERNLSLVQARVEAGQISDIDLARAEAEYSSVQANLIAIETQIVQLRNSLAILTGQLVSELDVEIAPLDDTSIPNIPQVIPSELLRRRPDIVSSEQSVVAANALIGVAKAGFFPSFNLNAGYGRQSQTSNELLKIASETWSVGPGFTLPIFRGGELTANLDAAEALYLASVSSYRQSVLEAVAEVEVGLATVDILKRQTASLQKGSSAAERASRLARERYQEGLVSYFDVVDAERQELDLKRVFAQVKGQQLVASVGLVGALGGGWTADNSRTEEQLPVQ